MSGAITDLVKWREHVQHMDEVAPGFWDRRHPRAMGCLNDPGYQFGYEISGYGTIVGYCAFHKPHPTEAEALECGRRFFAGEPPRLADRMPWRLNRKGRSKR